MKRILLLVLLLTLELGCITETPLEYRTTTTLGQSLVCSKDFDCVTRVNNVGRVRACHKDDISCMQWGRTDENGDITGEEYPMQSDVYSSCRGDSCIIRYNPDRCVH